MKVKDNQIRIRIDSTLKERFAHYAKTAGQSQSRILRDYMQFLVDQKKKVNHEKTN